MTHNQNFKTNRNIKKNAKVLLSSLHLVDVIYKVDITKQKKKRILKHINLKISTNEMYALMGSSGSGKTTLLDLIAQRKLIGTWSGNIFLNNSLNELLMKHDVAYVLQDDIHIPTLTVEETLLYAAWTKLPDDTTIQQRKQRVDEILVVMSLDSVRNNIVGDIQSKGISGGQLKRLSIAVEFIALQNIILLDEPTSGLDSSIALEVMSGIKKLVTKDRICLSTIHQPSKELFGLFNKVILLCMGRIIFSGSVSHVIEYFTHSKLGYTLIDKDRNPAEFIIDICCGKILSQGSYHPKQAEELEILFKTSNYYFPSELCLPRKKNTKALNVYELYCPCLLSNQHHNTSIYTQTSMLFHRSWTAKLRSTNVIKVEIFYRIAVALLFGIVFFGKGHVEEPLYDNGVLSSDARSCNSLLSLTVSLTIFVHMTAISALSKSFLVYKRELSSNAYRTTSLFLSEVFALLPWHFFLHSIFIVIVYLMTSMKLNSDCFFYVLFLSFIGTYIAYSIALLTAFTLTDQVAFIVYQLNFKMLSAFAGFMIHVNNIPIVLRWISYIAFSRWYYEGLMVNQWNLYDTDDVKDDNERNGSGNVLEDFGFDNYNKNNSFGILLMFLSIYLLLYYYALTSTSSQLIKEEAQVDYFTVLSPSNFSGLTTISDSDKSNIDVTIKNPIVLSKTNSKIDDTIKHNNVNIDSSNEKIKNSRFELEIGLIDNDFFLNSKNPHLQKSMEEAMNDTLIVYEPVKDVSYFYSKSISVSITKSTKSTFVFKDICCTIEHPNGKKTATTSSSSSSISNHSTNHTSTSPLNSDSCRMVLLNNVSGHVQSGEMCALMGTSGAGKSTLLDVLTRRKTSGLISGSIVLNGESNINGFNYVPQEDLHYAQLTVEESIYFSAELKLDSSLSQFEKSRRITDVMNMLAIDEVKDSIIGPALSRNISGGQLRRVSIAVEIICLYQLFYLDEPTTGLDSATALEVLSAIRNLTNINQMITICSIHQPSEDAFALFDKLLLLGGGRVIYFGPISGLINYFTKSQFQYNYQINMNPADFVISIANSLFPTNSGKFLTSNELSDYYLTTIQYQATVDAMKAFVVAAADNDENFSNVMYNNRKQLSYKNNIYSFISQQYLVKQNNGILTYRTSLFHQIKVLLYRRYLIMKRMQNVILAHLIRNAIISIFYGLLFFQMSTGSDSSCYDDRLSLLFFSLMNQLFVHVNTVAEFYNERGLYFKEKYSKSYRALAYFFSLSIPQMILQFSLVLPYSCILYNMTGLRKQAFGSFLIILLLCNYIGMFLGLCVSSLTSTAQASLDYFHFSSSINWLYCGFFIFLPDFPDWEGSWLPYLVYMRYCFQGLVLNEFQNNNDLPLEHTYIHNMGYDTISIQGCISILLIFIIFFAILFYLLLCYFYDEKR